jgi:hypothetical protein
MTPRERNLFFDYGAIGRVQQALAQLNVELRPSNSLDEQYQAILGCFYAHGQVNRARPSSDKHEPWMTFLSTEELKVTTWLLFYF